LESFKVSNQFFNKVHQLGCLIALDDFGTGYSSLSYLTQISVDTLKIDREFIKELDSSTRSRLVTQSIIDLAKRLKLRVCAEGVENQFQQDYLTQNECNQFQGYLYSKPMPLKELANTPSDYHEQFKK
jgi:EAL domain-containing protein (putative c-di-GMP-specific phosphodiesterase class I)